MVDYSLMKTYDKIMPELAKKNSTYLEIGVKDGESLRKCISLVAPSRLILCDTYSVAYGGTGRNSHEHIEKLLIEINYFGEVIYLDGKSQEQVPLFNDKQPEPYIDIALIDGDHSAEGAAADLVNVWRALKVGGVIFYHDIISPEFPTLSFVLAEFLKEVDGEWVFEDRETPTGTAVIRKRSEETTLKDWRVAMKEAVLLLSADINALEAAESELLNSGYVKMNAPDGFPSKKGQERIVVKLQAKTKADKEQITKAIADMRFACYEVKALVKINSAASKSEVVTWLHGNMSIMQALIEANMLPEFIED